jgi:hypothetical protein
MAVEPPEVFVIRIWFEPAANGRRGGRGYVEHVTSRQRRYFMELGDALDFVAAVSAMPFHPAGETALDDRREP